MKINDIRSMSFTESKGTKMNRQVNLIVDADKFNTALHDLERIRHELEDIRQKILEAIHTKE